MADPVLRKLVSLPFHLAQIVAGALQAEGIDAVVRRDGLSQIYALNTGAHATRIYVRADQFALAQAVIADSEAESDPPPLAR